MVHQLEEVGDHHRIDLVEREKSGRKWELYRVHENSPLAEDCSEDLHGEERLRVAEERFQLEEEPRAQLARERFERERAAGMIDDEEYGDNYYPAEEDS